MAGCYAKSPKLNTPTPVPTPTRGYNLAEAICQASDFPSGWIVGDTITQVPPHTALSGDVVDYLGATFDPPSPSLGNAGCHVFVYEKRTEAQRALDLECSQNVPGIDTREVGEDICAFGYDLQLPHVTIKFMRGRTLVVIMTSSLSETEVWHIAEAVDGRLQ